MSMVRIVTGTGPEWHPHATNRSKPPTSRACPPGAPAQAGETAGAARACSRIIITAAAATRQAAPAANNAGL